MNLCYDSFKCLLVPDSKGRLAHMAVQLFIW